MHLLSPLIVWLLGFENATTFCQLHPFSPPTPFFVHFTPFLFEEFGPSDSRFPLCGPTEGGHSSDPAAPANIRRLFPVPFLRKACDVCSRSLFPPTR